MKFLVLLSCSLLIGWVTAQNDVQVATAFIEPLPGVSASGWSGKLNFYYDEGSTTLKIRGTLDGYPATGTDFAVTIYQFGNIGDFYDGLGVVFNPDLLAYEDQAGNLASFTVPLNATGPLTYSHDSTKGATLSGDHSVLGRAIVVHNRTADLIEPFRNYGWAAGAGVIGFANPDEVEADFVEVNAGDVNVATASPTATQGVCHMGVGGRVDLRTVTSVGDEDETLVDSEFTVDLQTYPPSEVTRGSIIHEYGDISDLTLLGEHYTTTEAGSQHGLFPSVPRHAGDLQNMEIEDGASFANFVNDLLFVPDVIGRSFAMHTQADDGTPVDGNVGPADDGNGINRFCVIGVGWEEPIAAPRVTFEDAASGNILAAGPGTGLFIAAVVALVAALM